MPLPGELLASGMGQNSRQPKRTSKLLATRPHIVDSSGADLDVIDGYLSQLLPALAGALDGNADPEDAQAGLANLGLDRAALLARGVPQHSINALYRSMAAHADAFKKLVAGQVQQLQQLLSQQAGPQLQSTIQLLDGPIASSATQQTLLSGRVQAMKQSLQQQQDQQQKALTATAAESISAAGYGSGAARNLGPSADDLVKDYADAYASMKETMEVRLRHEQRRGDFLQNKLQQTESSLKDTTAQLEAANRRVAEQRSEIIQLADQISGLQSDVATSHAAHLALQQHHQETMKQAAAERQQMEELHKKTVETLHADLTVAGGAAAALAESSRQAEALRLLYNEELSRASRLAVELSRATAAADRAAAEEEAWRRQLTKSDDRADNAEGMAEAMKVTVKQLDEALQQEKLRLEAKKDEAAKLRLMLERSRLASVKHRAEAQSTVLALASKVQEQNEELSTKQSSLHSTEDNLKLRMMELEGANAQLQASRTHLKQLMSDLETEQEKSTSIGNALAELKQQSEELVAAKEIAEGRMRAVQVQLSKANDSSAMMSDQLNEVRATLEERTAELNELQDSLQTEYAAHAAVQEHADHLKAQVAELQVIEQQYGQLRYHHEEAAARLEKLEQEHVELTAKARQLELTTEELQSLQTDHVSLQSKLSYVEQQLHTTSSSLGEAEDSRHRSEAQVLLLQDKLTHADGQQQRLARELLAVTSAGDSAYHQVEHMTQQLDSTQSALEAAEADRQALVAQRDAWMASFQEAYGKLQEWKAANQSASQKLAGRAAIIQTAMQHLSSQMTADTDVSDSLLTGRRSLIGSRTSVFTAGSNTTSADGSVAVAGTTSSNRSTSAAAAGLEGSGISVASTIATSEVLDQMSALQQLLQAEAAKHQEQYGDSLEELSRRVQERAQAAQAWVQEQMAATHRKKAARTAAAVAKKKHKLAIMTASQRPSVGGAGAADSVEPLQVLHHAQQLQLQQHHQHLQPVVEIPEAVGPEAAGGPGGDVFPDVTAASGQASGWDLDMQPSDVHSAQQPAEQQLLDPAAAAVTHPGTATEAGQMPDISSVKARVHAGAEQAAALDGDLGETHSEVEPATAAVRDPSLGSSEVAVGQRSQLTTSDKINLLQSAAVGHGQQPPAPVTGQQPRSQQQQLHSQQQQQQLQQGYQQLLQQHRLLQQQHHMLLQRIHAQQVPASQEQQLQQHTQLPVLHQQQQVVFQPPLQQQQQQQVDMPLYAQGNALQVQQPQQHQQPGVMRSQSQQGAQQMQQQMLQPVQQQQHQQQEKHCDQQQQPSQELSTALDAAGAAACAATLPVEATASTDCAPGDAAAAEQPAVEAPQPGSTQQLSQNVVTSTSTTATTTTFSSERRSSGEAGGGAAAAQDGVVYAAAVEASSSSIQQAVHTAAKFSSAGLVLNHSQGSMGQHQGQLQPVQSYVQSSGPPIHNQGLFLEYSQGILAQQPSHGLVQQTAPLNPSHSLLLEHSQGFVPGSLPSFQCSASLLSTPGLEASSSSGSGSTPGGGFMSGFVSMMAYQDQMKAVGKLHGQVGEMAVQLREAQADAEGAVQQLQQERQETASRTTALRGALGQLHGQIEELRTEHEALQAAHRHLVAKDLMKSGILKDRYVADLFARLQEAEWRLDVARRRACTWGFEMMVPMGQVDRAIQTQYAEVWASEQQQGPAAATAAAAVSPSQASIQRRLQQGGGAATALTSARPHSGGSSSARRMHLDPLTDAAAGMSAAVNTAATGAAGIPLIGSAGSPSADSSGGSVQRRKPGFAQHVAGVSQQQPSPEGPSSSKLTSGGSSSKRPSSAEGPAKPSSSNASISSDHALYAAAQELLAAGTVELLSAPALLQLLSSLYSSKAAADATALRSHSPAVEFWEFVLQTFQKQESISSSLGSASRTVHLCTSSSSKVTRKGLQNSEGQDADAAAAAAAAATALAQLLGSLQQHASSSKEISQFAQALAENRQQRIMLAQARANPHPPDGAASSSGNKSSNESGDSSSSSSAVMFKGSWAEVRLDNNKLLPVLPDQMLLLPGGLPDLVERILLWPGMTALLGWVAQGHFLVGLREGSLGRILMDVQAPHIHFLLLEASDILGLHPLPRVQVVQAATPFVRLLRVPRAQIPPSAAASKSITPRQQQQQLQRMTWQQDSLIVMSSAALQLLGPAELQVAIAAALVPAVLAGGRNAEDDDPGGSSSSSIPQPNIPGLEQLSPSRAPGLCELATLSSLLALQPTYLLSHLPTEMHAMGSALEAAMQAADRVVAVAGDRAGLLVSQDLNVSLAALLKTGGDSSSIAGSTAAAAAESDFNTSSSISGSNSGTPAALLREWQERVQEAVGTDYMPSLGQLLPQHESLQQPGSSSGSRSGSTADVKQVAEDQVLLLRVQQLLNWSDSEVYKQVMAAAKPLRRILPPGRRIPSA